MSKDMDNTGEVTPDTSASQEGQKDLKDFIATQVELNQRLLEKSERQSQPKEAPPKHLSQEEINELIKTNPALAMEATVERLVSARVGAVEKTLNQQQQKTAWDAKAEQDFQALKKDKEFRTITKQYVDELVSSGEYDRESPKLIYRAAQLASSHFTKTKASQHDDSDSVPQGGEPPSRVSREKASNNRKVPDNFDAMSRMFFDGDPKRIQRMKERQGWK